MSFFADLAVEWGERRRRLRRALGDKIAAPLEFLIFLGFGLGAATFVLSPDHALRGIAPFIAAVVGYVALDWRRQAALARGVDPARARRGYDLATLALIGALAIAAVAVFAFAQIEPPPARIEIPDAPPKALIVDIE